jgi:MFS family permease
MASAAILGMIVTMFRRPRDQAKAIGIYSSVASAGASIGLLAGGVLVEAVNWHWIFFVNLPIGIGTAFVATHLLDRDEGIVCSRRCRRGAPTRCWATGRQPPKHWSAATDSRSSSAGASS